VRARHICGDTIPDFSRITRQQQFLRAVMARVLRPAMLLHATSLVPAVLKHLFVDPGLKKAGISEIVALIRKLQGISTGAVDFRTVPSVPALIDTPQGQVSIVKLLPQAKLLFQRLRTGEPLGKIGVPQKNTPPSTAVISVRVYDDSSRGKARKVTDYLTRGGFDIQPVATGSLGQTQPVILYRPGAKAEAGVVHHYLSTLQMKQAPKGQLQGIDVAVPIDSTYEGPGVVKQHNKRPGHPTC